MTVCNHPGCLCGGNGNVHGRELNTRVCEHCRGTGTRWYEKQGVTMFCDQCGGAGLKDKSVKKAGKRGDDSEPVESRGLIQASER